MFHHRSVLGLKPLYLFNRRCFLIDSFSVSLISLSSFYSIYLEYFWNKFYARDDFYVSVRFRYTVGSGGGDGAANFAELDSDFSEPGKHV